MHTEPITALGRQATELLSDIKRDKQPILITQHGLPSDHLADVEINGLTPQRIELLEGILIGEQAIAEGRITTHVHAKSLLSRWLE